MSTTAISDMSDSNTTVTTAESTIVGNDSTPLASGLENDWSNNSSADYPHTTQILKHGQTNESILDAPQTTESVRGSETKGGIPFEVSSSTAHPKQDSTSKGIIILIFILILIVCLLVILYFLRKKSRSYSFDLSRPDVASNDYVDTPLSIDQQGISYEPTTKGMYLPMCLDYLNEDNTEEKTNPIANGSTGEQTEQTPTNESDFQNFPEENSFSSDSSLASPMKKVEFNLDLDLLGSDSELNNTTEAEATNTEQNENNNNVSNAGQGTAAEIFTEISLDEPKQHA
ncbi:Interleukin-18 receptor 1 [Labeo rohita]|uniref:Interleukin-18 receptor 1 n=1 Tax=Labeo rohita TaxID=84645 RepID=A0ABQ8LFE0_LABRO|nr:Interleukin-18 receptor 1 [Labeo rohita]